MASSNRNKKLAAAIRVLDGCSAMLGWLFLVALFAVLAYSILSGFFLTEFGTDVLSLLIPLGILFAISYGALKVILKHENRPPR